ncbi:MULTISPECIES: alanine racemase [Planococcus]|uniref:Alanine racemase n=2 Tax=Planococcus TaxID=1372 RepID=A0ABM5WZG6_9BACL|nr:MULTISPECIES: alanine racemase [Planococcus]ALS79735.1 alanine racemase [Planococcus kocurii]AQU78280.1 alanine racemase [Planococcus faecalis]OHX53847.1 alanine racemase [Planococcus faecalis]
MTEQYRPTKAVISLEAIKKNLTVFQEKSGDAKVIAVVKADAYGHGVLAVAKAVIETGVDMLAVATPDEALFLRDQGIETELLVLGATPAKFIRVAQQRNIIVTAISLDWLSMAASHLEEKLEMLKIHLKVDTGMRRIGIQLDEVDQALGIIADHDFSFNGIFTHFATADEEDSSLFNQQVHAMNSVIKQLEDPSVMVHVSNSAAAIMHPELTSDAVRVGISLYGIAPSPYVGQEMEFHLYPALSLETEIVHVKKVKAGEALSYGATYRAARDEWVGTIPIGYADGMLRGLQGQDVLVNGQRTPIIGRICMDQCMIRLSKKVPVGEKVQLIGRQGEQQIFIDEWADRLETIPYEIPCILTKRVPRVYSESAEVSDLSFHKLDKMVR